MVSLPRIQGLRKHAPDVLHDVKMHENANVVYMALPCCTSMMFVSAHCKILILCVLDSLLYDRLSCAVQVGSGFDVSAAVYGTHTYTRFSPSELADALAAGDAPPPTDATDDPPSANSTPIERITACVEARGGWDAERGQLRLPSCFRLLMGDVCGGSSTPSMVRKVI